MGWLKNFWGRAVLRPAFPKVLVRHSLMLLQLSYFELVAVLAFLALLVAAGCAVTPPGHDTARHIQSVASLATAIQFHTNALPAEAPSAPNRLTLATAVERALRQSPELQIALANVRAAQADAHQSRLLPNPVLDIAFRFPEGGGRTVIVQQRSERNGTHTRHTLREKLSARVGL